MLLSAASEAGPIIFPIVFIVGIGCAVPAFIWGLKRIMKAQKSAAAQRFAMHNLRVEEVRRLQGQIAKQRKLVES